MPPVAIAAAISAAATLASTISQITAKPGGGAKPAAPAPAAEPSGVDSNRIAATGGTLHQFQPGATTGFLSPEKGVGAGAANAALQDIQSSIGS